MKITTAKDSDRFTLILQKPCITTLIIILTIFHRSLTYPNKSTCIALTIPYKFTKNFSGCPIKK